MILIGAGIARKIQVTDLGDRYHCRARKRLFFAELVSIYPL